MGKKNVKIEVVNGTPEAKPDSLKWLYKKEKDSIEWTSDQPFTITLHHPSDFEDTDEILVSSEKNGKYTADTGSVTEGAPLEVARKYDIDMAGEVADPDYRVKP